MTDLVTSEKDDWKVKNACRDTARISLLPDPYRAHGFLSEVHELRDAICESGILVASDLDQWDYISANWSTQAINFIMDFDMVAVLRPIRSRRPFETDDAAGELIAEVLVFDLSDNHDPVDRFIIEVRSTPTVAKTRDYRKLQDDFAERIQEALNVRFGGY